MRRIDARDGVVLLSGLCTTALAFAVMFWLDRVGEPVMGFYSFLWGFIPLPAGALGVGLVASLGYGAASFLTERRVSGKFLVALLLLLGGSYFAAHYVEYRRITAGLGERAIGFWDYFDRMTRSFAWNEGGRAGEPLGELGYGLRALELFGFVAGGLIVPATLRKKPYCDGCRCYRQSKLAAIVPIGQDEAAAHRHLQAILAAAKGGVLDDLGRAIATHGPLSARSAAEDSPHWLSASLLYCPKCAGGALLARTHQRGTEARRQVSQVVTEIVPLDPRLVRELLSARKRSDHPYR